MRNLLSISILFLAFISFSQAPTAIITANSTTVCLGQQICFSGSSSTTNGGSAITNYAWNFGNGVSATGVNFCYTFLAPGTYTITLVVTNASGQADAEVKTSYITIKPAPIAAFNIAGVGCTVPLTLVFNNTRSAGTCTWDFDNGSPTPYVGTNPPSQTYNSAGTYDITLTVTDPVSNCSADTTQSIVVSNYQAGITMPTVACVGQPVTFIDNSTAGANSWTWNFAGAGSSSNQNPSYTFNTPGTYTIQLVSQNTNSGCSGSASQTITVQPTPTPSFTANPTSNCAPATINFTNSSIGGSNYVWNFGNGSAPYVGQNPPPQVYTIDSTYDVSLTMTSAAGCVGTTTLNDYINITNVHALFQADVTGGCGPLTVHFTNNSTTPTPTNPIVSWQWNFGNGQTYSGQNPPAQVYQVGVYDVILTVTSQSGCTDTDTLHDYIAVGQILSLDFTVDTLVNCIKTDFEFTSHVVTNPANPDPSEIDYFWDFTDGTSTEENPHYQFTSDTGYFDVSLIVNFRGCKDTLEIDSLIKINAPISKFNPDTTLFCNPNSLPVILNITDQATHGELSDDVLMVWKWGDGTPNTVFDDPDLDDADLGSTSHTISNYGSYTVEQVIYNYTTGCSDSITRVIDVSTVTAQFATSNDSICQGDSLFMFDASSTWMTPPTPHPLDSWEFDMGNGTDVDMGDTANYVYPTAGSYIITLTATNSVGCFATSTLPITVLAPPFAVLASDLSTGCSPFLVNFTNGSISLNGLPLTSFDFLFTDDSTHTVVNSVNAPVSHTFVGDGVFFAELVATDQFGCVSPTASLPITITRPNAFFSVPSIVCNGDSIQTVNSSTGVAPLSYQWQIDGVIVSNTLDANALVNETGIPFGQTSTTHTVNLIATDGNGCKDTIGNLITVSIPYAKPTYSFTGASIDANGNFTCPPVFGTYTDSSFSYGSITDWNWNFGNAQTSSDSVAASTIVFSGCYDLFLQITDQYGCIADSTVNDYICVGGPEGTPSVLPTSGGCQQSAQFEIANAQNIYSVVWNMGDNNTVLDTLDFSYQYENPGVYSPSVTIYDSSGCPVTFTNLPNVTVVSSGLTASFTATPNPVDQDAAIVFTDQSVSASNSIISWNWDFGNNQTANSTTGTPQSYAYPSSGPYTATLTVTDALGCFATYQLPILVNDPQIWVPNVFTPNGDNSNELFNLPFDGFQSYHITIMNRWGNVVWDRDRDSTMPLLLWDGTNNGGTYCTDGVYFYHLTGVMKAGTEVDKQGFVTLVEAPH
jgi:gliding motility-associated-like protein